MTDLSELERRLSEATGDPRASHILTNRNPFIKVTVFDTSDDVVVWSEKPRFWFGEERFFVIPRRALATGYGRAPLRWP